ncbi:hypothetical protein VIMS_01855 [Mycobacterium marinum]|nr:hypothetical protein VIMS_01855 [Mycobacterium marinum]
MGEGGDGGGFEHINNAQTGVQGGVGGGDQTHRRQGIPAEVEEGVGGTDPVTTEDLGVEAGQGFFHRALRGEISLRAGGVVGGGQGAAVEFAVDRQR